MIIELDKTYRITSDEYNFILQKKTDPTKGPKTRKGKKLNKTGGWRDVGYWKGLDQLLLSYSRHKVREGGVTSLKAVCRLLDTLSIEIKGIGAQCVNLWGRT